MIVPADMKDLPALRRFLLDIVAKIKKPSSINELPNTASNKEIIEKINEIIKALK